MAGSPPYPLPTLVPLGDSALLVRFADGLDERANRAAIAFAQLVAGDPPPGVDEIVPNLVSVMLRYDPNAISFSALAGELRLRLSTFDGTADANGKRWTIEVCFDGADIDEVSERLGLDRDAFIAAHNSSPLRVLATGFAPGFVYCGMHAAALTLPRRPLVRPSVPAGSVLFAAGQTAIAATAMPTGWHLLGHTRFRNFDAAVQPPTQLRPGDTICFTPVP